MKKRYVCGLLLFSSLMVASEVDKATDAKFMLYVRGSAQRMLLAANNASADPESESVEYKIAISEDGSLRYQNFNECAWTLIKWEDIGWTDDVQKLKKSTIARLPVVAPESKK